MSPESQNVWDGTVRALMNILALRDPFTAKHQRRVSQIAVAIAREMGASPEFIEGVRVMGLVHDLGKIAIPGEILCKPGRLNQQEFELVKIHPRIAHDILLEIRFPWPVALAVLQHHERLDGSGYPNGFARDEIIPEARILAVADVVETMASHRPYRLVLGLGKALQEIAERNGRMYDAEVVAACLKIMADTTAPDFCRPGPEPVTLNIFPPTHPKPGPKVH